MRTVRSLGAFVLCPLLVLGILADTLLPPEHVHLAGIEGRTHATVHRHALKTDGGSGTSVSAHGSHDRAVFLNTVYDGGSGFVTHTPAVVETAIAILPVPSLIERVQADDAYRAHGPPGSTCPTRAPPPLA
jgi:hypothetical protein